MAEQYVTICVSFQVCILVAYHQAME